MFTETKLGSTSRFGSSTLTSNSAGPCAPMPVSTGPTSLPKLPSLWHVAQLAVNSSFPLLALPGCVTVGVNWPRGGVAGFAQRLDDAPLQCGRVARAEQFRNAGEGLRVPQRQQARSHLRALFVAGVRVRQFRRKLRHQRANVCGERAPF